MQRRKELNVNQMMTVQIIGYVNIASVLILAVQKIIVLQMRLVEFVGINLSASAQMGMWKVIKLAVNYVSSDTKRSELIRILLEFSLLFYSWA